jgi:hypothetical protein
VSHCEIAATGEKYQANRGTQPLPLPQWPYIVLRIFDQDIDMLDNKTSSRNIIENELRCMQFLLVSFCPLDRLQNGLRCELVILGTLRGNYSWSQTRNGRKYAYCSV